jgi:hypothetical protein
MAEPRLQRTRDVYLEETAKPEWTPRQRELWALYQKNPSGFWYYVLQVASRRDDARASQP